jgi:hypothetical protein
LSSPKGIEQPRRKGRGEEPVQVVKVEEEDLVA